MWAQRPPARDALLTAAGAAAVAALLAWLGPPGGDLAAHEYQRSLFLAHGFTLWDNYWYAGRYVFVGYSVLYYPLAALVGIKVLAVLEVAAAAGTFTFLLERRWGDAARPASLAFALVWAAVPITGEFPFALGVALALGALLALRSKRRWIGAGLILLALAASPVAFLLLAVALAGIAIARRAPLRTWAVPGAAVAVAGASELVLLRLFPASGTLGFPASEAAEAAAFCIGGIALTWRAERASILRAFLAVYLVAVVATYAIPSGLGHDVARIRLLALPLALLIAALRGWRPWPVALAAVALAGAWNVVPLATQWNRSAGDRTQHASTWAFTLRYLNLHLRPGYRVEAVDTTEHWPALYLADTDAGIPLVRGWFRQDDFPTNAPLYHPLSPRSYLQWLRSLGVRYVVLADAPPDNSSRGEAELVRSGRTTLRPVAVDRYVTVFAVPRPRSIVSPRGKVLMLAGSRLVVSVPRPGTYRIAVHWSPYWRASTGCLARGSDGMLRLTTSSPGPVQVDFDVTVGGLWRAFTGATPRCAL
jgi:hypothetical protein